MSDYEFKQEVLALRGRLELARRKYQDLDELVSLDLISIRNILNPWEEDVTKLDIEKALVGMKRLHANVAELRKLKETMTSLQEALGE